MEHASLQNEAERTVDLQVSIESGTLPVADEGRHPDGPYLQLTAATAERLFVFVHGTDALANCSSRDRGWKRRCRERAWAAGALPLFLEVIFLEVAGRGRNLFTRGLDDLNAQLRRPRQDDPPGEDPEPPSMLDEMEEHAVFDGPDAVPRFREELRARERRRRDRLLREGIRRARGKSTEEIPRGDYCYTTFIPPEKALELERCKAQHGEDSAEYFGMLFLEARTEKACPYRVRTNHGTVQCLFLEIEAVVLAEGCADDAEAHFGSPEAAEEHCTGFLLGDAVRECRAIIEAMEAESSQAGR